VADALKTAWRDMLKEPAQKLLGREGEKFCVAGFRLAVVEGDPSVFIAHDSLAAQRGAIDISGQILQDGPSRAGGLDVDDPLLPPDLWGDLFEKILMVGFQELAHTIFEAQGEHLAWQEKLGI
jgi:hypothetical protein